jgi:eukaryotic-like serine/threonine-protein kinase
MQAHAPKRAPDGLEAPLQVLGKYALFAPIASGGMATVHLGRLLGDAGFARTVAIKRLASQVASEESFVAMLLDEARLASRFRHANVAATVDVVSAERELWLVMDYVHGESFRELLAAAAPLGGLDSRAVGSIAIGALHGLHAAHEATTESGEPLGVVHRDVSPQNILVGKDGIARVVDFGVAKAIGRLQQTNVGQFKGKPRYMAPEALRAQPGLHLDRRTDIFSMGAVLWEALTGRPLFDNESKVDVLMQVLTMPIPPPESIQTSIPPSVGAVVMRALRRDPAERFATAEEFALALEEALPTGLASQHAVGSLVQKLAGDRLRERERVLAAIERTLPGDTGGAKRVLAQTAPRPEGAKKAEDQLDAPTLRQKRDELLKAETYDGVLEPDDDTDDSNDAPTVAHHVVRLPAGQSQPAEPQPPPQPEEDPRILQTIKMDLRQERPLFVSDGNTVKMSHNIPAPRPSHPNFAVGMVTEVRQKPVAPFSWLLVLAAAAIAILTAAASYFLLSSSP